MDERGAFKGSDARIGELGFPSGPMSVNGISIADLFFSKTSRCGVYVLGFAIDERYVGLSTDVVKRFGPSVTPACI